MLYEVITGRNIQLGFQLVEIVDNPFFAKGFAQIMLHRFQREESGRKLLLKDLKTLLQVESPAVFAVKSYNFV